MRRVYITDGRDFPASQETLDAAAMANCPEILSGIPPALTGIIPADHIGVFDVPIPDDIPPEPDPITDLQAQIDALTQQLADAGITPQADPS